MIQEAFKQYSKGETIQAVTDMLNLQGMRTRNKRPLNSDNTTRMLKNRKYIGEYHFRDMTIPNGIPAIVTEELFDMVQERFAKNRKAPARYKAEEHYILTTKLHCGKCGAYMVGESGTSATGRTYNYYKCVTNKNRKGCDKKAVAKHWIEDLVIQQITQMLSNDNTIQHITDMVMDLQKRENTALPLLKKQLKETEKANDNMLNAIAQGIITASTKQRLTEYEEAKSQLEVSILQEELKKPVLTEEQVKFWLHKFRVIDTNNPKQRQRLIDGFVNAIYVYDDRLVFTFNYKDGTKEISLADIDSSDMGAAPALKSFLDLTVEEAYFYAVFLFVCGCKAVDSAWNCHSCSHSTVFLATIMVSTSDSICWSRISNLRTHSSIDASPFSIRIAIAMAE